MISARGNGTFGVEYDEAGSPKEDRIAESRLRRRHVATDRPTTGGTTTTNNNNSNRAAPNSASTRGRSDTNGREVYEEDDTVSVAVGGDGRGGGGQQQQQQQEWKEAKVEAYVGDEVYRVRFTDGSGTRELDSGKLR